MPRDDATAEQLSLSTEPRVSESAGRYDVASEGEASAIGRALLAELRGEELTASQQEVLSSARAPAPDLRAPTPVVDSEQTLLCLSRGRDAELRVRWRRYRGSTPFLDLRRFERPAGGGELRPTRAGVTVRGHEVSKLISALVQLEAREAAAR